SHVNRVAREGSAGQLGLRHPARPADGQPGRAGCPQLANRVTPAPRTFAPSTRNSTAMTVALFAVSQSVMSAWTGVIAFRPARNPTTGTIGVIEARNT